MAVTPVGSAASVYGAEKISKSPEQQLNEYRSEREELKKQLSYDDSPNLRNRLDTLDKRIENLEKRTGGREECETCKNRKYQDGSNENVSFKAATHISPRAAAGAVRAHEGEHVANAYSKAAENNGKVVRASVSIHTAVCPECGTTYVPRGTTDTVIKYDKEDNPYRKNLKSAEGSILLGANFDAAV